MRNPAAESRHNLQYWRYGDYAGIGPGAHGRTDGRTDGLSRHGAIARPSPGLTAWNEPATE